MAEGSEINMVCYRAWERHRLFALLVHRLFWLHGLKYFVYLVNHFICEVAADEDGGFLPYGNCYCIAGARIDHYLLAIKDDADNGIEGIILEVCYDHPAERGVQAVNYVFDQIVGQWPRRPAFLKPQCYGTAFKMADPNQKQPSGQFILENNLVLS